MRDRGEAKILVGIDFTPTSERAIDVAAGLAERMRASLCFLHVPGYHRTIFGFGNEWSQEGAIHELETKLRQLVEKHLGPERVFEARVLLGRSSRKGICDFARSIAADLLVIGTDGRGGWRGLLRGARAGGVMRESPCAVVSVGPAFEDRKTV